MLNLPLVQVDRAHEGDVDTKVAVDARALYTDECTQRGRGPSWACSKVVSNRSGSDKAYSLPVLMRPMAAVLDLHTSIAVWLDIHHGRSLTTPKSTSQASRQPELTSFRAVRARGIVRLTENVLKALLELPLIPLSTLLLGCHLGSPPLPRPPAEQRTGTHDETDPTSGVSTATIFGLIGLGDGGSQYLALALAIRAKGSRGERRRSGLPRGVRGAQSGLNQ